MIITKSSTMITMIAALALCAPLPCAAEEAVRADTTVTAVLLNEQIDKLITDANLEPEAKVEIYMLDGKSGQVLIDRLGETAVPPASCNKLMTVAVALSLFGPDYKLYTNIYRVGEIDKDGTLKGDLVVVGAGDPTLCGRFEEDKMDVKAPLRRWADAITSAGIKRVEGDLIADARIFDQDYFNNNWFINERGEYYEAEIWGLTFNEGCVDLKLSTKDLLPGGKPKVELNPPTDYVKIDNEMTIVGKGRASERLYIREDLSNDILATGTIDFDFEKIDSATVCNGPLWCLSVLRDVLTSAGITVSGTSRLADPSADRLEVKGGILVYSHESRPMTDIVNTVNRVSQNFYADSLNKLLGAHFRDSGSWTTGCSVIHDWMCSQPIWTEGLVLDDGSGLSYKNLVAPRTLVELQRFMDNGPYAKEWRDTLPQGGVRGSLKSRFAGTDATDEQKARIFGKTGYIDGVRSLCGIMLRKDGTPIYYMINIQKSFRPAAPLLNLIDNIVVTGLKTLE